MTWFGNYNGDYFGEWFGSIATLFLLSAVYDKTLSLSVYFEVLGQLRAIYDPESVLPLVTYTALFNLAAVYDKNISINVIHDAVLETPLQEP